MDREEVKYTDAFGPDEEKPQNDPTEYKDWSIELAMIPYQNNTYGLYLQRGSSGIHGHQGFFQPYTGENPDVLYFSIRTLNNKNYIFIDETHQTSEGLIRLSPNPARPLYRYCVPRKVSGKKSLKYSIVIPSQIVKLMPEIKTTKRVIAVRVPIPGKPEYVRYQLLLK